MALAPLKTWVKETLTFQDLNAEFLNILNNAQSLISPATGTWDLDGNSLLLDSDGDTALVNSTGNTIQFQIGGTVDYIMTATGFDLTGKILDLDDDNDTSISAAVDDTIQIEIGGSNIYTLTATAFDFNGKELILDADGDSSLTVDTDDVAHLRLQAFDAFIFEGDTATIVNGITLTASDTGNPVTIAPHGETNTGLSISPAGSGTVNIDLNGGELIFDVDGDSSITVDTDDVMHVRLQGFDTVIFDGDVATPVNGLTFTSSATGADVTIGPHGETNTSLDLLSAGTGVVKANGVTIFGSTSVAIIAEQQSVGDDGGTFTSGAWQTRLLNIEVVDDESIATLASNQFTLGAGTYVMDAWAVAREVDGHQARIYNITDTAEVAVGSSMIAAAANAGVNTSVVHAHVTITGSTIFELQHQCQTTKTSVGFGFGTGYTTETFSSVMIRQIA